ncbi:hypothetical protein D3C86_1850060 [compost metagenome]
MQLVEQRFELVIGDQFAAHRCGHWRRRDWSRSDRRFQRLDREVALAVQLIEQCFELFVGDVGAVACRFRRGRCGGHCWRCGRNHGVDGEPAFTVQLIEQ